MRCDNRPRLRSKRYGDGCYAVVKGNRRGPCAHSRRLAVKRYRRSGLIAYVGTGR
jgi:hypothetical protein